MSALFYYRGSDIDFLLGHEFTQAVVYNPNTPYPLEVTLDEGVDSLRKLIVAADLPKKWANTSHEQEKLLEDLSNS